LKLPFSKSMLGGQFWALIVKGNKIKNNRYIKP
jgi:hypothetical protein